MDLNMTATEIIKFQAAYDKKNVFLKTNAKPSQTMAKKIVTNFWRFILNPLWPILKFWANLSC